MKKFTLLELLIVIGIIGILLTILLPSMARARELSKRAVCLSNLRQSHLANTLYANNNNDKLPPGNAVFGGPEGVESVMRIQANFPFGASIPYHQNYLSSPDIFYCPSSTHESRQKNKMNGSGTIGGYNDPGYPAPTKHYVTSYVYRGVIAGEARSISLSKDDSSSPYMGDHWTSGWGVYSHVKEGYSVLKVNGSAKFNNDKPGKIINLNISKHDHFSQGQFWDTLFYD